MQNQIKRQKAMKNKTLSLSVVGAALSSRFTTINLPIARTKASLREAVRRLRHRVNQASAPKHPWAVSLCCAWLALSGANAHGGGTFNKLLDLGGGNPNPSGSMEIGRASCRERGNTTVPCA